MKVCSGKGPACSLPAWWVHGLGLPSLPSQVVIFVKSVQRAKMLNQLLQECNFPSVCIYGGMDQEERIKVRARGLAKHCTGPLEAYKRALRKGAHLAQGVSTGHVLTCMRCFLDAQVYKNFKEGKHRILVATDLVGRGIDIERVNIVINYDMPESDDKAKGETKHGNGADTYLHRVSTERCTSRRCGLP